MNSKERVLRALRSEETDRVPFGIFSTNPPDEARMAADLRCSSVREMYELLGLDVWHFMTPLTYIGPKRFHMGKEADYFGVPFDIRSFGDSSIYNPLAEISSIDEVEAYNWPNNDDFDATDFDKQLNDYSNFAVEGGLWAPIFHNLTWLCGFENTLANLVMEPDISKAIIRHITDFWISYLKKMMECAKGRVDIVQNCNDFGTQLGLIMSKEMFQTFFKPELKRVYDVVHSYGAKVLQHSCGAVHSIIDDFIEIGADIINPVQVNAQGMEIRGIAKRFGGRTAFYGGIDTQKVLPLGGEETIREAVRTALDAFSPYGKFILGPSQGIEADIPTEHVRIMFDEAIKHAKKEN